jgi:hypothetical protein
MASSASSSQEHLQEDLERTYAMVDDSQFLHGRVDPGIDENLGLVDGVPGVEEERLEAQRCPWNDSREDIRSFGEGSSGMFILGLLNVSNNIANHLSQRFLLIPVVKTI